MFNYGRESQERRFKERSREEAASKAAEEPSPPPADEEPKNDFRAGLARTGSFNKGRAGAEEPKNDFRTGLSRTGSFNKGNSNSSAASLKEKESPKQGGRKGSLFGGRKDSTGSPPLAPSGGGGATGVSKKEIEDMMSAMKDSIIDALRSEITQLRGELLDALKANAASGSGGAAPPTPPSSSSPPPPPASEVPAMKRQGSKSAGMGMGAPGGGPPSLAEIRARRTAGK